MKTNDVRQQILDAAEELFISQGFANTSTREITRRAAANVAAVNYYFDTKELLAQAVIERRFAPLNNERIAKLKAVRDQSIDRKVRPAITDVLNAYVLPLFELRTSDKKASSLLNYIGRCYFLAEEPVRNISLNSFGPVFSLLLECIELALPMLSKDVAQYNCQLVVGTVMSVFYRGDNSNVSGCSIFNDSFSADLPAEVLIAFLSAGLDASTDAGEGFQ